MAVTRIKQTETIHPSYIVAAKCYHQARGESRIRVPRMYTAAASKDGSGMKEYLLTRYINKLGVDMSSLLELQRTDLSQAHANPGEDAYELVEVCREGRKQEEQMIIDWYTSIGGTACESEYSI